MNIGKFYATYAQRLLVAHDTVHAYIPSLFDYFAESGFSRPVFANHHISASGTNVEMVLVFKLFNQVVP